MGTLLSTPVTLAQIRELVGGELHGEASTAITSVAGLANANGHSLSFVADDKAAKTPGISNAGALLIHRYAADLSVPQLVVANPKLAFALVTRRFFVPVQPSRGIAPELTRGADVVIGADVSIWPGVTLGDRVRIGARVTLYPGVFIGDDSTVGDDSVLYPNVVLREGCTVGARVIIHSGTVVGSDGFGYVQDRGKHVKIPQLGGVILEDDVELGANVTIDRGGLLSVPYAGMVPTLGRTLPQIQAEIERRVHTEAAAVDEVAVVGLDVVAVGAAIAALDVQAARDRGVGAAMAEVGVAAAEVEELDVLVAQHAGLGLHDVAAVDPLRRRRDRHPPRERTRRLPRSPSGSCRS